MNLIVTTNPKLNNRYTETREKEHKHATEENKTNKKKEKPRK